MHDDLIHKNLHIRPMANAIRALTMDAVQAANSGHPGMPMGMADVATVLFTKFLAFDAQDPTWPDRDRFVLSAGHGSMLLYSLYHLTGYAELGIEDLKAFRQLGSRTPGHPEVGHTVAVETTTGPLGQGLANAVGMALAERLLNARFGDGLVDHYTYAIAGDGCLMEGISHEAASLAGHLGLSKLVVLFDDNSISIDGATNLAVSDDQLARFAAYGWYTARVDGHDPVAIEGAIAAARDADRPALLACRTTIGFGAPTKSGKASCHGSPLGPEEIAGARKALEWDAAPFEIPEPIRAAWLEAGARGRPAREAWEARRDALSTERKAAFEQAISGALPADLDDVVRDAKAALLEGRPTRATRKSSQASLDVLAAAIPGLLGGSADLTGSNNTQAKSQGVVGPGAFEGRYMHYGVREHAMGAVMNGVALHGGFIPYGGTFLVFSDYCRPAIRMSALMEQRVVYVMTHDSIGLGEDGPTHQPIEHLASLRAMPNVAVLRPADAVETLECWQYALHNVGGPSVLALTRQDVPALRDTTTDPDPAENRSARGAYVLHAPEGPRDATLIASGSEVALALDASRALAKEGLTVAVVSMPCWEAFAAQPAAYRAEVLGSAPRVAVEAGASFGWHRWVGERGTVVGIDRFGASGPAEDLFEYFGLVTDAVADKVRAAVAAG
ncbi:MAG: transketolase [Deltaproteobacteria bacterium]|nr:transketolase [Deltaproteobacteria bacterium]